MNPSPQTFRLANGGTRIEVMDHGASWLSCVVTLADGSPREVVLAAATPMAQLRNTAFLGQTIGRYANRIGGASFAIDGQRHHVAANEGANQLHGGAGGLGMRRWQIGAHSAHAVSFEIESAAGEEGFPGRLHARATYRVEADGSVSVEHYASVDQPCPVGLTNHVYFNLDGTPAHVTRHSLRLRAAHYLPTDAAGIPLGELAPVSGGSFDFRAAKPIERDLLTDTQQRQAKGYDHAYLLDADCAAGAHAAAELTSSDARLTLRLFTSLPALQLYSGQHLAGQPARHGRFDSFAGIALEPQFLPDSPNHPEWPQPSCILRPGQHYAHFMRYVFVNGA